MATITLDMKAGDIVRRWPETLKVFARYKLDLRCGGVHALEFAAQKHGFNLEQMLEKLNAVLSAALAQAQ
jgi:iron-sulfur cluster repair protein YtfE (RIC family)